MNDLKQSNVIIRTIHENDAKEFLRLCKKLDEETQFMMLEPGERSTTVDELGKQIAHLLEQEHSTILVAEHHGQLVGYIEASGGHFRRNHHSAYLVIGILQAFSGQGIGKRLFSLLEDWASQHHIHRLELTVMAHNHAGIALYKKRGFAIEGVRRHSMFVNGCYIDEFYMAKILDET